MCNRFGRSQPAEQDDGVEADPLYNSKIERGEFPDTFVFETAVWLVKERIWGPNGDLIH